MKKLISFLVSVSFLFSMSLVYSAPAIYVDPSGNTGIGNTTPTEKLDVNGAVKAKELKGDFDKAASGYVRIGDTQICWGYITFTSAASQTWTYPAAFVGSPVVNCSIYWNGLNVFTTIWGISGTQATFRISNNAPTAVWGYCMAIGRWR